MPAHQKIYTDIEANRASRKWSPNELLRRALWEILSPVFFVLSPRQFWIWRRILLRLFGASIGQNVHIFPNVKIAVPWNLDIEDDTSIGDGVILYALGKITIGARSTISQYSHLCAGTHDHTESEFPLLKRPIAVGDDVWICAESFIGPDVTIGDGAIVGARSVVINNIEPWSINAGNPTREIRDRRNSIRK